MESTNEARIGRPNGGWPNLVGHPRLSADLSGSFVGAPDACISALALPIHCDYAFAMKVVEKWKWRIRWAGRWTTTRIAMTEDEIQREHREATRVDGSRIEVELPETEAEVLANQRPPTRHASARKP
jgi:hypothetical protein